MSDLRRDTIETWVKSINPSFIKLLGLLGYGRVFVRAEGTRFWDARGRSYTDFLAGFGSVCVGHHHPRLVSRIERFLREEQPVNLVNIGPGPYNAELARTFVERLGEPLSAMMLASSGGEAVEAGMKLARAATRRRGFVYCRNGYHGTNFGSLSVMGEGRMRKPFEPLLSDCVRVPFGDLRALRRALRSRRMAGFVVEPLQAEGGVVLPPPGYLAEAQALCRRYGTLLILDEVQTGLGRTGHLFAFEGEGFVPDVLVLAKALGAGMVPISAALTHPRIHRKAYGGMGRFDLHSSTYGGNALGCVVATETLRIVEEEGLVDRSRDLGKRLLSGLRARVGTHPLVREVRGRGLLVGIELGPTPRSMLGRTAPALMRVLCRAAFAQWINLRLLEAGIVSQPASHAWDVLRLEPPLTISEQAIDEVVEILGGILDEYEQVLPLIRDVSVRFLSQMRRGWAM